MDDFSQLIDENALLRGQVQAQAHSLAVQAAEIVSLGTRNALLRKTFSDKEDDLNEQLRRSERTNAEYGDLVAEQRAALAHKDALLDELQKELTRLSDLQVAQRQAVAVRAAQVEEPAFLA